MSAGASRLQACGPELFSTKFPRFFTAAKAQALTGVSEKTALLREALRALIQRESAKRLALLGGSEPQLEDVPRR